MFPYDSGFWERKFVGRIIFDEDAVDADGTVILDESVLMEEETGVLQVEFDDPREKEIVENMLAGWREGEYSVGQLKAAFDRFIK